ncbi:hypothetical protein ACKGJO_05875 [Gracilimonas sp. Q87]|uniref:hypothetical protein n=1 Tax=Gracilimonas sp. Q87 TaxID=3384766 RepID=UPI00398429BB
MAVLSSSVTAQSAPDREIIGIAKDDGRAYIYHAQQIPLSHGYNIYRSENGNNWTQLNDEVFYPASDGYDLEYRLQEQFELAQQLTGREEPQAVFLNLRRNSNVGLIANFASPAIALEMGRLYIDEEAPIGEDVYYRFEIVDDLERPTGENIQGEVDLEVIDPPAPSGLEVANRGRTVDLSWEYVPNSVRSSRYIIRFQIFYRPSGSEDWIPLNSEFLARTTETTEFNYSGEVPRLDEQYEFVVQAVDFTGALSDESNITALNVMENIPPDIVRNVQVNDIGNYTGRITWNVSTELDLEGYHVYRARDDQEEYSRITSELLSPLQTVYEDSVTEPGHQYRYKITALDTMGNESELSNAAHVFIADERVPNPVTSIEATLIDNEVARISWENGEVPGGLRSYQILRREKGSGSGGLWSMLNSSAYKNTFYEDTGIGGIRFVEGTTIEYGVAIVSENGSISDTVITAVKIPDITPPDAPDLLEAKMQDARRVGITWNASSSSDVTHYRLYKRETESGGQSDSLVAEVRKGERYFREENVSLYKTYIYSLSAIDSVGNESEPMVTDTLSTQATHAPERVRNVQAVKMNDGVVLAWEEGDVKKLSGYVIYRSEIATGVYDKVAEVEVPATRWTDAAGESGVWYKIHGVDKSGRESRTSKATQAVERN